MVIDDKSPMLNGERNLVHCLSQQYQETSGITVRFNELRNDASENGQFYREHWELIQGLIAAGCGRRNTRTEAIKSNFLEKLRVSGANIKKSHERDLYVINEHQAWLKCNTLTPITTQYWNGWHEGKYEEYGRSCVLILLCGSDETAVVLPPELHRQYFVSSKLTERRTQYDYYSTSVIPHPNGLKLKIRSEIIDLNNYINNFTPIGVHIRNQPHNVLLARAHYIASSILSSARSSQTNSKKRYGDLWPNTRDTYALVTRKINEIRSFLAGVTAINPSSETICYWVWFCYEFGLYNEGAQLFTKVDEDLVVRDLYKLTHQLGLACEGRC
jgi:hypothetical protein